MTLCNPIDCSTPGFPVFHYLPNLLKCMSLSQWCHPTISSSVNPFCSWSQSFPASKSFSMSHSITGSTIYSKVEHKHAIQKSWFCYFIHVWKWNLSCIPFSKKMNNSLKSHFVTTQLFMYIPIFYFLSLYFCFHLHTNKFR